MLIDGQAVPNARPELTLRANQARQLFDSIFGQIPEGAKKSGADIGYLENYLTHIEKQPDDIKSAINSIIDYHFGEKSPLRRLFARPELSGGESGTTGDIYNRGQGKPSSPFTETRTGNQRDIEYDVNKIFPAYVESIAKVMFDKPAVQKATELLKDLPDSNLKEL